MDQTEESVERNTSETDESYENDVEERENQYCGSKTTPVIDDRHKELSNGDGDSSELQDDELKQVRFEENGDNVDEIGVSKDEQEEHLTTENGVGGDDNQEDVNQVPLIDDSVTSETLELQVEKPATDSDEENTTQEQNLQTENSETTEESQRDSIVDSELSEETRPDEEECEKDFVQMLQKESQYDRTSSFSSLSVNIGSTQQDSDSEQLNSSRASPAEDETCEEGFEKTSMENKENFDNDEEEADTDEIRENEDGNNEKTENQDYGEEKGEREKEVQQNIEEDRQVKQVHGEATDEKDDHDKEDDIEHATTEDVSKEEESESEESTLTSSEPGLELTKDKEEIEEEANEQSQFQEKAIEDKSDVHENELPEVLLSCENKDREDKNDDENGNAEAAEAEPVCEDEEKENTKVKELGRLFQEKTDENPKAMYPKEATTEKSPVNVRRFREMFEHGEPLLSPAAYAHVPEEECTSPRPGIVKNLRDLFEDPKNFEWKESAKTATVVN